MKLPKAEYPLTDIFVYSLDKNVGFRPFLVKEEKILRVEDIPNKSQSQLIQDMYTCITSCLLGELDASTLPIFDIQNIWIILQRLNQSPNIPYSIPCSHCDTENTVENDFNEYGIYTDKTHISVVDIRKNFQIKMRYPTALELCELDDEKLQEQFYDMAASCIELVKYDGKFLSIDEEEKIEIIENMTQVEFKEVKRFFETMPVVQNIVRFNCDECDTENAVIFDGWYKLRRLEE